MFLTTNPVILTADVLVKKASKKSIGVVCAQLECSNKAPNNAIII
nr:MAG TPA: hypothetical protein [Caudoviricetes sp.]